MLPWRKEISVGEVFPPFGEPTVTYVRREGGRNETALTSALKSAGQLCLITGPSKTGKTTLYRHVLRALALSPVIIRCANRLQPAELWLRALELLNASRITELGEERQVKAAATGKLAAVFGLKLLSGLKGGLSATAEGTKTTDRKSEKFLSSPSIDHLVQRLKGSDKTLVIEDFHYLSPDVRKDVFQEWKTFVDSQLSIIVIGTTHHAIDIADANQDLIGRICHIDISAWSIEDLKQIGTLGFGHLGLSVSDDVLTSIAVESAGLPILTQQICQQLLWNIGAHTSGHADKSIRLTKGDVKLAIYQVACQSYRSLEDFCQDFISHIKSDYRYNKIYSMILSCFEIDPITFSLSKGEIAKRFVLIDDKQDNLPPDGLLVEALNSLNEMRSADGAQLLEWHERKQMLHVVDPSFLFYLRWRKRTERALPMENVTYARLLDEWARKF